MNNIPKATFRRMFGWGCVSGCLFALIILSTSSAAYADTPPDDDTIIISSAEPLSDADLDVRGGAGNTTITTVSASQTMNSTTSGNALNVGGNLTNGSISAVSFGGSGFGSYVMNTGNNSTINSGVSLSVLMLQ